MPPHAGDGCPTCSESMRDPTGAGLQFWNNASSRASRTILLFAANNMARGRLRPRLMEHWGRDADFLLVDGHLSVESYRTNLYTAKFCLFSRGHRCWSPNLMDFIWSGCIPVIVSDNYQLPLQELVDWSMFSLTVAEANIEDLKSIILSVSESKYVAMANALEAARARFIWNQPSIPGDSFYSMLTMLWRRRHLRYFFYQSISTIDKAI